MKLKKLGWILLIYSIVIYGGFFILPFLKFSFGIKAIIGGFIVISAEVSFYLGLLILGKEYWAKIKQKARNIFRKSNNTDYVQRNEEFFEPGIGFDQTGRPSQN